MFPDDLFIEAYGKSGIVASVDARTVNTYLLRYRMAVFNLRSSRHGDCDGT